MRYGIQGSGEGDRTVEMASGDSSGGMYQISGLSAATVYAIEVAAVNSAGTGDYSDPLTAETPESKCTYLHVLWNEMNIYLIDLLTLQVCTSV